jgi:hypothetical protein
MCIELIPAAAFVTAMTIAVIVLETMSCVGVVAQALVGLIGSAANAIAYPKAAGAAAVVRTTASVVMASPRFRTHRCDYRRHQQ